MSLRQFASSLVFFVLLICSGGSTEAIVYLSEYPNLKTLEANLNTEIKQLQKAISDHPTGSVSYSFTNLRNLIELRHSDYLEFLMGGLLSKEYIEFYKKADRILEKHDEQVVKLLHQSRKRFDKGQQGEIDTILKTITQPYGGELTSVTAPDPQKFDSIKYLEQQREYVGYRINSAIYDRDYETALDLLLSEEVKQLSADDAGGYLFLLGRLYYTLERYSEAVHALEEALPQLPRISSGKLDLSPKQKHVAHMIAEIYANHLRQLDRADMFFEVAYREDPEDATLLNNYAWFLIDKKGDLTRARPLIVQAITDEPDDPRIMDTYGYLLLKEGQAKEAYVYFKKALLSSKLDDENRKLIKAHLKETKKKLKH